MLFAPTDGNGCDGSPAPAFVLLGGNMDSDGSCDVERTEPDPATVKRDWTFARAWLLEWMS